MARRIRAANLETRSARLRLPISSKPVWVSIGHGLGIGYRRNQGPGTWNGRQADGKGGYHSLGVIAVADDYDTANGASIMDFWQAQDRIRALGLDARHGADGSKLLTVAEAVDAYAQDLQRRNGDVSNAARIRLHLPDSLAGKTVTLLVARDFKPWRDALVQAKLAPDTINRVNTCLKAALNLAADQDERIANRRAWETALAGIPDAGESRNTFVLEDAIRAVVASAYKVSSEFGLLTEVAACSGARVSQIARLEVQDVQVDRARLMMPTARKGRGRKRIDHHPVPIPADLAARLAELARERPAKAPLLVKLTGEPWRKSDHTRLFARAVKDAGLEEGITFYGLRHTSIARALLAGVPVRVVAANHDTSVAMIEKTYSRYIGEHSDTIARRGMLDLTEPPAANVVPLRERQ
jgi:integrase